MTNFREFNKLILSFIIYTTYHFIFRIYVTALSRLSNMD